MPAHYITTAAEFLHDDLNRIIGQLTSRAAGSGFYQQQHAQTEAWQIQINCLKQTLGIPELGNLISSCSVLLEYPIPRRSKRIDTVLLINKLIFVLEFKCGARDYLRDAIEQVEDYSLDLRDFHEQSTGKILVPVVVCTHAPERGEPSAPVLDNVAPTWLANAHNLGIRLASAYERYKAFDSYGINIDAWNHSNYRPTPTIIESAQSLYSGQNVREISRCSAGVHNLTQTSDAVINGKGKGDRLLFRR